MLKFGLFLAAIGAISGDVYVEEEGSPYDPGSLSEFVETLNLNTGTGIPLQTRIDYPAVEEELAVLIFLTGFQGVIPPQIYSQWLSRVAAHGFIVVSPWLVGDGTLEDTLDWVEENLSDYLLPTLASWDNVGYVCHSAGCETAIEAMVQDPEFAQGLVMIDPVVFYAQNWNVSASGLFFGTNASCTIPGFDYISAFDKFPGPKIKTGNDNFGHCFILDEYMLPVCQFACPGGAPEDQIDDYISMLQGFTSGLMINALQGRDDVIDYLLDPDVYPVQPTDHDASQWEV